MIPQHSTVFDLHSLVSPEVIKETFTICTSKLPSSDLLMDDEGQLERVERPVSVCLPLRSCRLNMTANTHKQTRG